MLVRLLEILVEGLVRGRAILPVFNLVLENLDIVYYVFVTNKRYVCL